MGDTGFPAFRAVADHALLVEFGDAISDAVQAQVWQLDAALRAQGVTGFVEAVPALVNLLVEFDPGLTDHAGVAREVRALLVQGVAGAGAVTAREVAVCYEAEFAPDLDEVAQRSGLSPEAVIAAHLAAEFRVAMYGFAPGYAYLGGLPDALRLPRKDAARRGVAAGSVIIAGAQCLVTTLTMPTGWWIIGRSPTRILRDDPARSFLFDVGDPVRFRRIRAADFGREG